MKRCILSYLLSVLSMAYLAGCSGLDTEDLYAPSGVDAETVVKEVNIAMKSPEVMDVNALVETKTYLYNYDTVGVSREHMNGKWYRVGWSVGDKTYCYCQTGVYMNYVLSADDILSGTYYGEKAKTHVIYRVGDSWVALYFKGPKIGEYKGFRGKERLVLANGVPSNQTGKFEDYHICLARNNPEADFVFENMQAYLRFEVTESTPGRRDGTLLEYPVTKIVINSLSHKDKMAGDLEMIDDGGWRTILQDRGVASDSVITVIPEGGQFKPSPTVKHYFVAVPARRYADGIRLSLYTKATGVEEIKGYVDVPGINITKNQILNIHDLLKYCALVVTDISLDYGDLTGVEYGSRAAGISLMEGHTGLLKPVFTPSTATDKSLKWVTSNADVVSVDQSGKITAQNGNAGSSCWIKVYALDMEESSAAKDSVLVKVTTDPAADALTGYTQAAHSNW